MPILAGLLTVAGLLHVALLKDLRHPAHWALALAVGIIGFRGDLAVAIVGGLMIWWLVRSLRAWQPRREGDGSRSHAQPVIGPEPTQYV
ncbi:hypothetical protein [Candidatus Mycobacterium methanotrophicum]|uniref:Uncharacterized protein n=1 Tax=Candidatus Mycobacterium methanotrophicum TaxID=2943498 RepID=A0ABY4QLT7_9MYCO|nr:hypothetical protein [Candidatus Mycobacterium methanotrophicum]UQX11258.1 hypothetical protein M5I08_01535 [Candidatus Mycobacterium methanotrophicum]